MAPYKHVMEIFTLLEKSNCRRCNAPTCLAFASAVFKGQRRLDECPRLSPDAAAALRGKPGAEPDRGPEVAADGEIALSVLQQKVAAMDLAAAAAPVSGRYADHRLTLKVLGKDFSVDTRGSLSSDIHINPWVGVPVLGYILSGAPWPVSGEWVPFRELKGGSERNGLFTRMCETPMKRIADSHPQFFEDLIRLFSGRPVEKHYRSDISLVLHPLPKVPILICYWKAEEGMDSSLHLFFDRSASHNLETDTVYTLIAGIARMFEKLFLRHGLLQPCPAE